MMPLRAYKKKFPKTPGIYIMKDKNEKVIYVGKAGNLNNRIKSYFRVKNATGKTGLLIKNIKNIEVIETPSEEDALKLEEQFIKKYTPKYNIRLKDDKKYPYIQISFQKKFPRVRYTRNLNQLKSEYFGPYTSSRDCRRTLAAIKKIYPVMECNFERLPRGTNKACLYYHIHRCPAPCIGNIDEKGYSDIIDEIRYLLNGHYSRLISLLEKKMNVLSRNQNYESAAAVRDKILSVKKIQSNKSFIIEGKTDSDVIYAKKHDEICRVYLWSIREGRLMKRDFFAMETPFEEPIPDILNTFLVHHYLYLQHIPGEIIVSELPAGKDDIEKILSKEKKCKIIYPLRGKKKKLLEWVKGNAKHFHPAVSEVKKDDSGIIKTLHDVSRMLNIPHLPVLIEAFDVSNLQGKNATASMVSFFRGTPLKKEYRRFSIKIKDTPDDYAMLKEAVHRRYRRRLNENSVLPDLIIVDGGAGQVNAAFSILRKLNIHNIPLVGLAKSEETLFFPENKQEPVKLPKHHPTRFLFQRIRDESHRFALKYHRLLRKKSLLK